ncbi:MAG: hypothetical protein QXW65_01090 [Candidatus Pacearchaeota archaeon]
MNVNLNQKQKELSNANLNQEKLPLVLEIIPGQAKEGLLVLFKPGEYEEKNLEALVKEALEKEVSIEERDLVEKIKEQLDGGKLLHIYNNKEVKGEAIKHAVKETTEVGEKYLYIGVRVIKPEEGGSKYGYQY